MSFHVELHPDAVIELKESYDWYEARLKGTGVKFLEAIQIVLRNICTQPGLSLKKKQDYRAAAVEAFPYFISYEVLPEKRTIFVSSFFGSGKNPA